MIAITVAWIASIFVGMLWYNGHRFQIAVDAGAIGILRVDWHPSLHPSSLEFKSPGDRSLDQFWRLCPSVKWYSNQQWIAIPMWIVLLVCAAPLVIPELWRYRRSKRLNECFQCGYSLDGLQARTCPECGATSTRKRPPLKFSFLLLACFIIPLALMFVPVIW